MWMPRFSLVITSYNQREFIKDAVDSALSLPNPEKEIIVVDDGSADGTQAMLRQYGEAIRLVCFETHQGSGAARNCGANLANGEYLVFLDGDDAFLPWALDVYERIVQAKKPKMILRDRRRPRADPRLNKVDLPGAEPERVAAEVAELLGEPPESTAHQRQDRRGHHRRPR